MKKVYINGYFTKERINGVPRYSYEIVKRIDKFFGEGEAELVVPKDAINIPPLNNIKLCTWEDRGCKKEVNGVLWGNITYKKYVERKGINVNFSNRGERVRNSITAIHDLISLTHWKYGFKMTLKEKISNYIYYWVNKIWFLEKIYIKKYCADYIVTVSEFSKKEICRKLKIHSDRVKVAYDGWEHVDEIVPKNEGLDDRISPQNYYFFIGNILPHKNMQWIFSEALYLKDETFVIAGKIPEIIRKSVEKKSNNVIFLGYVSDNYMKWLMLNSKALLFPSLAEGFGLPPLECLAMGGRVIMSDLPVFREIYGNAVSYIDVKRTDVDLNMYIIDNRESVNAVLNDHTWEKAAKIWFELIERVRNNENNL